jgi:hypothetical protein
MNKRQRKKAEKELLSWLAKEFIAIEMEVSQMERMSALVDKMNKIIIAQRIGY